MILITGATGFIGGRMLEAFIEKYGADAVVGTGRNPSVIAAWQQKGVTIVGGDLSDAAFVASVFQQFPIKTVIHVAAKSSPWGSYESFYQSNVVATRHLLEQAQTHGVTRLVYISTPSIYFNYTNRFNVKEDEPIDYPFVNHYTSTKYEAELLVRAYAKHFFTVIFRPRALVGRGDTVIIPRVLHAYHTQRLRIVGDGKNMADFTSVANLCHAAMLAMEAGEPCNGQIFNITDGEPQVLWDFIRFLLQKKGLNDQLKRVPYPLAYGVAWLQERFNTWFKPEVEPALTCYGIGILTYSLTMDISKARDLLGYQPLMNPRESLLEFIAAEK
ncbi:MAG: NAD-dependent epimerase/dehydratase family protein [Saprospiraceae bacterium]|nr:NAD-dependent epimerase/dehydratase family protein [Saprospiraceae bacterium]